MEQYRKSDFLTVREQIVHARVVHIQVGGQFAEPACAELLVMFEQVGKIAVRLIVHRARVHIAEPRKPVGMIGDGLKASFVAHRNGLPFRRHDRQKNASFNIELIVHTEQFVCPQHGIAAAGVCGNPLRKRYNMGMNVDFSDDIHRESFP